MRRLILIFFAGLFIGSPAFAWGREGHETIAKIADNNLQASARRKIEKYLGDRSITYYAKWMDEYRHTPEYSFTTKWHVARVDNNLKYSPYPEAGDAISGIAQAVEILRDYKNLPDSTVAVNIKYLLHLVGDMHCPAHVYYLGRNQDFKVKFGGGYIKPVKEMKIHTVWDEAAIQSSRIWSVSEWAEELDRLSSKEKAAVTAGTPVDWLEDNARRCVVQFDMAAPGDNVAQDFVNEALPLIETQILYAGYRLAALLNSIF
jgi:hypothetical protein